jgi:hypothetical protein
MRGKCPHVQYIAGRAVVPCTGQYEFPFLAIIPPKKALNGLSTLEIVQLIE